jgi:hypothetical protein
MKPTKRCDSCNKPIWDHDYIIIYDPYMEMEINIHGQCFEAERLLQHDAEAEAAMVMETDFHR